MDIYSIFISLRSTLTILLSEKPKLYTILAFLSAIGLKILEIGTLKSVVVIKMERFGITICKDVSKRSEGMRVGPDQTLL